MKHVVVGNTKVYDQDLIYVRVLIGLIVSSREIDFDEVLAYDLVVYPPSIFNSDEEMNISSQLYVQSNSAL